MHTFNNVSSVVDSNLNGLDSKSKGLILAVFKPKGERSQLSPNGSDWIFFAIYVNGLHMKETGP